MKAIKTKMEKRKSRKERTKSMQNKADDGKDDLSKSFPNFVALTNEERSAFFEALTAARKNVEKSGTPTTERFGTVHDEYLKYFNEDVRNGSEDAAPGILDATDAFCHPGVTQTPSSATVSVPRDNTSFSDLSSVGEELTLNSVQKSCSMKTVVLEKPSGVLYSHEVSNEIEIWNECESFLEKDKDKIVDLYLSKKQRKQEECWLEEKLEECSLLNLISDDDLVPDVNTFSVVDVMMMHHGRLPKLRNKENIQPEKRKRKEPGAAVFSLKLNNTPRFNALNAEEREIFFNILKEAHNNFVEKNPDEKTEIVPFETILRKYQDQGEDTIACTATTQETPKPKPKARKDGARNLRVRVTVTSGDNERLERQRLKRKQEMAIEEPSSNDSASLNKGIAESASQNHYLPAEKSSVEKKKTKKGKNAKRRDKISQGSSTGSEVEKCKEHIKKEETQSNKENPETNVKVEGKEKIEDDRVEESETSKKPDNINKKSKKKSEKETQKKDKPPKEYKNLQTDSSTSGVKPHKTKAQQDLSKLKTEDEKVKEIKADEQRSSELKQDSTELEHPRLEKVYSTTDENFKYSSSEESQTKEFQKQKQTLMEVAVHLEGKKAEAKVEEVIPTTETKEYAVATEEVDAHAKKLAKEKSLKDELSDEEIIDEKNYETLRDERKSKNDQTESNESVDETSLETFEKEEKTLRGEKVTEVTFVSAKEKITEKNEDEKVEEKPTRKKMKEEIKDEKEEEKPAEKKITETNDDEAEDEPALEKSATEVTFVSARKEIKEKIKDEQPEKETADEKMTKNKEEEEEGKHAKKKVIEANEEEREEPARKKMTKENEDEKEDETAMEKSATEVTFVSSEKEKDKDKEEEGKPAKKKVTEMYEDEKDEPALENSTTEVSSRKKIKEKTKDEKAEGEPTGEKMTEKNRDEGEEKISERSEDEKGKGVHLREKTWKENEDEEEELAGEKMKEKNEDEKAESAMKKMTEEKEVRKEEPAMKNMKEKNEDSKKEHATKKMRAENELEEQKGEIRETERSMLVTLPVEVKSVVLEETTETEREEDRKNRENTVKEEKSEKVPTPEKENVLEINPVETPTETGAVKERPVTVENTDSVTDMTPRANTGKVVLVDDGVIEKIKRLIHDLEKKARAEDCSVENEYLQLLLGYIEYLSKALESLICQRQEMRERQVQTSVFAAGTQIKFYGQDKEKNSSEEMMTASHSLEKLNKGNESDERIKQDALPPRARSTPSLLSISDSDNSDSEEELSGLMYVRSKKLPTTKIRIMQDLIQDRAEFVEGSIDRFKIVQLPQEEYVPRKSNVRVEVMDEQEQFMEGTKTQKFFRGFLKFCRCGKKDAPDENQYLENLKGEAVEVDVSARGKKDAASATLNESTMEVLKAAERKKIIEKYYKDELLQEIRR